MMNALSQSASIHMYADAPHASALHSERPSLVFQHFASPVSSRAFRLPSRVQNNASADFTTSAVVIRGSGLRSETGPITCQDRPKTFSA